MSNSVRTHVALWWFNLSFHNLIGSKNTDQTCASSVRTNKNTVETYDGWYIDILSHIVSARYTAGFNINYLLPDCSGREQISSVPRRLISILISWTNHRSLNLYNIGSDFLSPLYNRILVCALTPLLKE